MIYEVIRLYIAGMINKIWRSKRSKDEQIEISGFSGKSLYIMANKGLELVSDSYN